MRTTVRLDDEVMREAKQAGVKTGRSLSEVIEDALCESLARSVKEPSERPFRMITFGGSGVRPGVDLDDSAALLDLMESGADPS